MRSGGTVQVERVGYARAGHDSLHPLDAALNLPVERYSLEVRRRVAEAAASRSFDEALFELPRHTGAEVPKRQAKQLAVRAAEDFRRLFYEARAVRRRASRRPRSRWSCSREQLSPFKGLKPGGEEALEAHGDGWPPSTRSRRSCGARRSSCRA